ncbi:CGNR zinc finger domain-containing protein [Streptomyces sp. NPDC016845]|uniref:CGNR zinc finger domain-containing protein n=1 Tax=Streptomyces sp. NPDC016845 TaxID=3364972 RepID=UPI00379DE184
MPDLSPAGPDSTRLVLDLALTVRHDGHGGVADDLLAPEGLTAWVRDHASALPLDAEFTGDEASLGEVRAMRAAVRALFARAVRPGEPSPADAKRLLPVTEAVARLNAAAARVTTAPVLSWPDGDGAAPSVRDVVRTAEASGTDLLAAALARAALAFLASADRERLRACHAPRCVRYFLKEHPRQEWCKPSCGNRARVARHHERHNTASNSPAQNGT